MRVFVVTLIIMLTHGSASAEWIGFSMDGKGNTVYIDQDSVARKGKLVKIWVMLDGAAVRETMDGVAFLSSRTLHQYDCEKERFRFLAFALFSGNMGSGQMVHANHTILDWEPVPPKGVARRLLERVCKKEH